MRRDFPEVGNKGYDSKALGKEEKAWDEILTKFFNSQNPNGIKSELSQLQGRWRQLNTIQYNSLLTLPWWGFSVTMRLKKTN